MLWREPDYGKCGMLHKKFIRYQKKGIRKKLFKIFKGNKKFGWSMMDLTYVKDYCHWNNARRESQAISKTKGK